MDLLSIIANFTLLFKIFQSSETTALKEKTTFYPTYAHQIIDVLKKEVHEQYGLDCCSRGGSMPYDVLTINVGFESKKLLTINEARIIFVNIYERFRNIINENENIRPFLREYPFPAERIQVSIKFYPALKSKANILGTELVYVSCIKGEIGYYRDDESGCRLAELKVEPYEEALRIVTARN